MPCMFQFHTAPKISVNVREVSNSKTLGQLYELQCNLHVAPPSNSAGYTRSFQWKKNNSPLPEKVQQILIFDTLRLSSTGEYTCAVIIQSQYLNGNFNITSNNSHTISLAS